MSLLGFLKNVFGQTEEWRLEGEAEKYYTAKLLLELANAKESLDEARQDLPSLDIEFIIKRLRNALKLDKQVLQLAGAYWLKDHQEKI